VGDRAYLAARDHCLGRRHRRHVAVVKADGALYPGLLHRGRDRLGVVRGETDRLLDPQVLAGFCDGHADLTVQAVRRGDADRLDARISEDIAPLRRGPPEAVLRRRLGAACAVDVADHGELWRERCVRVVVPQPGMGREWISPIQPYPTTATRSASVITPPRRR
jgi:hypothetical protein